MTDIINLFLTLVILAILISFAIKIYKRFYFTRLIKGLSKLENVQVNLKKNPFLSLFCISKTPEYIITVYDKIYALRLYNGGSGAMAVHFANKRFSVRYSRMKTATYAPRRGGIFVSRLRGFTLGAKVVVIPEMLPTEELLRKDYTEVLVFNPAPSEVSYVVKEKNSIRAAFTGDEVCDRRIFTASTFEIFIDREARRIKDERLGNYYDPWSSLYKK